MTSRKRESCDSYNSGAVDELEPEHLRSELSRRLNSAYHRSKKSGLVYSVTTDYLVEIFHAQRGLCAVTGLRMKIGLEKCRDPLSISLDRIDSDKGYEVGNVRLVTYWANLALGTWGDKLLTEMAKATVEHQENPKPLPSLILTPDDGRRRKPVRRLAAHEINEIKAALLEDPRANKSELARRYNVTHKTITNALKRTT